MKQKITVALTFMLTLLLLSSPLSAQRGFMAPKNLPAQPTTVSIPSISPLTGPGTPYNSALGQWPGYDMDHFDYVADEYTISGNADGSPYTARLVVRRPADMDRFSGLVITEPMHPAGFAHGFEHNSVYIMDSGHIAVEVTTMGLEHPQLHNPQRYADLMVSNNQISEII